MKRTPGEILSLSRLFRVLDDVAIERLVSASQTVDLPKGRILFARDDASDAAYIVLDGEISIEIVSPDGRAARFATLGTGDTFGELAVLDGLARTADARAASDARVLKIGKNRFMALAKEKPEFAFAIIADLVGKIRATNNQIEAVSFRSLRARLAALLLELAEKEGDMARITQSELADRLSATREKVNMHLQSIRQAGAIALGRGRIEFRDLDRLLAFVDPG